MNTSDPSKRVLLIEDNPDDVELTERVFEKLGMRDQVQVIEDGAEAWAYIREHAPFVEMVLLDLNLPHISGLDLLRRIRSEKATQGLTVVALTASRSEPDLLQCFTMGVTDYLIKPLEADRFMDVYRKYVKERT